MFKELMCLVYSSFSRKLVSIHFPTSIPQPPSFMSMMKHNNIGCHSESLLNSLSKIILETSKGKEKHVLFIFLVPETN